MAKGADLMQITKYLLALSVFMLSLNVGCAGSKPLLTTKKQQNPGQSEARAQGQHNPCNDSGVIRLHAGFNSGETVRPVRDGQSAVIGGLTNVEPCMAISKGSRGSRSIGFGRQEIQYQGGADTQRRANIATDPNNLNNKVLHYWLQAPNVEMESRHQAKGRIQMNLYDNSGIKSLKMSVRMFLHKDMNIVKSYPGAVDWLTISEWWNNSGWTGDKFPFRISVNIVKEGVGEYSPLLFDVHAQTLDKNSQRWSNVIWERLARNFEIPVDRWVTLEYGFVEGNAETGRFYMAATVDGGERTVIFNIKNFTHHPDDSDPDGLSDFNPLKLYTSGKLIDFVASKGGVIQIYWDDLDVVACGGDMGGVVGGCEF
jgi:hypothetical protein